MEREKEVVGGGGGGGMSPLSASGLSVEVHLIKRRDGMKFETARIHLLSEVFIALALVVT